VTGRDIAASAAWWLRRRFGADPEGIWRAPGRANLIGEHTDYNDGWVLPFALARGTAAAAARRDDGMLALYSSQQPGDEVTLPLAGLAPGSVTGWAAYPAGVAWALGEAGYPVPAASIAVDSDLPRGAGLSSSAALECAAALALTGLAGVAVPLRELAALARQAENTFAGVPSGIMDQSASLRATAGHGLLLDCRSLDAEQVPFDPPAAGLSVLIIDTAQRHALADGEYAARREECSRAAAALKVPALRDAREPGGPGIRLMDGVLLRRARHVVTENRRVLAAAELLRAGRVQSVGPLLTASHESLRDDFEVSWPAADAAVAAALAAGALGARMMGGGFGGSVIALAPAARTAAVRRAVRAAYAAEGWPAPRFLAEQPAGGARRVS
jgi:galactokinase